MVNALFRRLTRRGYSILPSWPYYHADTGRICALIPGRLFEERNARSTLQDDALRP